MVKEKEKIETKTRKTIKLDKNQTMKLYQNKEKELQGISQRVEQIDGILQEMQKAELALSKIQKLKDSEKMLVNIGAGVLIECEVSHKSSIKVLLPGQVMTERNIDDVIIDIDKRKKELHNAKEKLVKSYNQTSQMLEQISKAFREMQLRAEQKKKDADTSIE